MQTTDFRTLAIERIYQTPELFDLKHLKHIQWSNAEDFWKWLAEGDLKDILENIDDLSKKGIKVTATHEAAHAVIAYILGFKVLSADIVFHPDKTFCGQVFFEVDNYRLEFYGNSYFTTFAINLQYIAGPGFAYKVDGNILDILHGDFAQVVYMLRQTNPVLSETLVSHSLIGITLLLNSPFVWSLVNYLSKILIRDGFLSTNEISEFFKKKFSKKDEIPYFIKVFQKLGCSDKDFLEGKTSYSTSVLRGLDLINQDFTRKLKEVVLTGFKVNEYEMIGLTNPLFWETDLSTLGYFVGTRENNNPDECKTALSKVISDYVS